MDRGLRRKQVDSSKIDGTSKRLVFSFEIAEQILNFQFSICLDLTEVRTVQKVRKSVVEVSQSRPNRFLGFLFAEIFQVSSRASRNKLYSSPPSLIESRPTGLARLQVMLSRHAPAR